jgi:sugar lactone lactonase YvrE
VIYDGRWRQRRRFATPGWGRGLAVADDGRVFVGVSATRARYLEPDEDPGANRVVAFDLDGRELGRWELPDVEQVWSVRLLSRVQGDALASCSAERAPA